MLYLFGFDRRGLDFYCGVGKAHYLMCRSSGSRRAHYIGSKSGRNEKGIPITMGLKLELMKKAHGVPNIKNPLLKNRGQFFVTLQFEQILNHFLFLI